MLASPGARRLALGGLALAAALLPLALTNYWLDVLTFYGLYVLLGLALNVVVGYTGLFNLGQAAFYGIGAYVTAILNTRLGVPVLLTLPVAAVAAGAVAYAVGRPILHLRGDYLALVTIGLGEITLIAINNDVFGLTGGPNGIFGIDRPSVLGFVFGTSLRYYYLVWAVVAVVIGLLHRLENSRVGRAWMLIREDEVAAAAAGVDVAAYKTLAFSLSAALAGAVGTLYAGKMTVIAPESFSTWESVLMFSIVILGGAGSIPGVFVGALGMVVLPELFRDFSNWRMLVFGAAMVAMMVFRPAGLWPARPSAAPGRPAKGGARRAAA
ncbi:branched-chain amino acid ABC transporter permease [Caldinitratiruptor microaerophilus]|uniref:Branched-chain amino acid ABC transporter permease n=1 Tax=Caldinitratiruptor microaerophilus TaxID=671077 RepID=A0AA35GA49_9FIRM|nr:branched-chain amino acid ABC transporter permease [Caldinitratiruptor microaerophilus]BDG60934.1 branched-chain amino acid ABC transporter permease [Caldinitratiruptor microaerophilus]